MSFNTLRGQIKTVLESITAIQQVKGYPVLQFTGYPSAYVMPSDNESDYETTSENVRTYAFIVRIFYETQDVGIETALDALEDVVDDTLDAFDQQDQKGSSTRTIGVSLPTGYTFLNILAHPSVFAEVEGENLLMAELRVAVRISIDVT